jgi:hypothetical protein
MAQRNYSLSTDNYSGTVAGVYVSYNADTQKNVANLYNPELKRFLEDAAISAALLRGCSTAFIR